MFITKYLLLFLFIYGKNIVESSVTSASDDGNLASGADTKTVGSDRGIPAGDDSKGGSLGAPELKLFKDDCSGNPVEMETTDFSQINYLGYLIYDFKQKVECTLVKFGGAEVWKKGVDSVGEPISVSYNSDEHKVVLFDDKKSVFYKRDKSGNWVHHLTIERNEFPSTATSGTGEGEGTTVELGSLYPDSGGSTVEIKASSSESAMTVELGSLYPESYGSTVDVTPKLVPAEEASKDKVEGEGITVEFGSLYPDSCGSTVEVKAKSAAPGSEDAGKTAGELADGDGSQTTPLATPAGDSTSESSSSDLVIKFFSKDPNDANNIVELDSTKYDKKNINEIRIDYVFKDNVECTLIKINDKEFWKHGYRKCQDYPTSLSYRNEITIIVNLGGVFLRYGIDKNGDWHYDHKSKLRATGHQSGGGGSTLTAGTSESDGSTATTPAETVKKTPVELDIKKDAGTDEFDYNKDGKIVTYTAKDNYAFNVVKDDKTEIWRTDKESEYASKVVLDGKVNQKKTVTIHLLNRTTKSYNTEGQNKPWNEYTDSAKSEVLGFELDIKSDDIKSDDYHFDVEKSYGRDLYIITFRSLVECSSVKVDDKEVWKHDGSKSEDVNPRTVTFCKDENRVRIHFGDHTIVYKKVNDKWKDTSDLKATSTNSTSGGSTATSGNATSQPSSGTNQTSGGDGSQGTTQPAGGTSQ